MQKPIAFKNFPKSVHSLILASRESKRNKQTDQSSLSSLAMLWYIQRADNWSVYVYNLPFSVMELIIITIRVPA